jgi:phosphate transport system substrate-binding protein
MTNVSRPGSPRSRKAHAVRRLLHARATALALTALGALALAGAPVASAAVAPPYEKVEGSGSSWAAGAVTGWIADVTSSGLLLTFTSQGSAQGRKDFANATTDFAVSDIGFRGVDPATGDQDTNNGRPYAYLPIVAGGTSFPYNLKVGGKQVVNLRLSGDTLAKIFTNQITSWADPAITTDNNGRRLPAIPIIPLVHAEGSGSTAQLTTYFDSAYPSIWRPYFGRSGFTEYYPRKGSSMIAQSGSDQIINYAKSDAANGVITYDEYFYAKSKNLPVVKVKNAAGYYTLPTKYNVAVALTQALIDQNPQSSTYLLQDLHQVFVYSDPRTYPLSSYSYLIIPTGPNDPRMDAGKRQALLDYIQYSVCQGQNEVGAIGYSPLPLNLVQASFAQSDKLAQADPKVLSRGAKPASNCTNETFVAGQPKLNQLARIAPAPFACDQAGAGPCSGTTSVAVVGAAGGGTSPAAGGTGKPGSGGSAAGGGGGVGSAAGGGAGAGTGAGGAAPGTAAAGGTTTGAAGGTVDPATGVVVSSAASGSAAGGAVNADQVAVPTDLTSSTGVPGSVSAPLALLVLVLVVALPPFITRGLTSRRSR